MNYFNDERYWDIKLLNKWFAISSILFLISIVWMFIDDNDDEYKKYQKEFRQLSIEKEEEKLKLEKDSVKVVRKEYESQYKEKLKELSGKKVILDSLEIELVDNKAELFKANMEYLSQKADIDELKYLYENKESHSHDSDFHENKYKKKFYDESDKLHELKLVKEKKELQALNTENKIKEFNEDFKKASDDLDGILKDVNLIEKKLEALDRSRMTTSNKIADIVRDLPIIDFMDPYYEVHQIVVPDVKYPISRSLDRFCGFGKSLEALLINSS